MKIKTALNFTQKVLAIMLMLAVLLPSVVKLSHTFTHHKHEVCDNDGISKTHFHETDLDCDFYKFKLTKTHFFEIVKYETEPCKTFSKLEISYYISLHSYQQLTQHLRGPPQLIS